MSDEHNSPSMMDTGEDAIVKHDSNFSPISILNNLYKGRAPQYRWTSFKKEGTTIFVCTITVPDGITGVGQYYSKKVAKYHAAVDALRKLGLDVDYDIHLEQDDDGYNTEIEEETKDFEQTAQFVDSEELEYKKSQLVQMIPLPELDIDDELFEPCQKIIEDLKVMDQPLRGRLKNRFNLAFLCHDFDIFGRRRRHHFKPPGSDMFDNPIGYINERCAKSQMPWPVYSIMQLPEAKPPKYKATISLGGLRFSGLGTSKKCAKFLAARRLVEFIYRTFYSE